MQHLRRNQQKIAAMYVMYIIFYKEAAGAAFNVKKFKIRVAVMRRHYITGFSDVTFRIDSVNSFFYLSYASVVCHGSLRILLKKQYFEAIVFHNQ